MWFQPDSAPAHFILNIWNYLNERSQGNGLIEVARSSVTKIVGSLEFGLFSVGPYDKQNVFIKTNMDIVARIASDIQKMPGDFANVRQTLFYMCETCITTGWRHFE